MLKCEWFPNIAHHRTPPTMPYSLSPFHKPHSITPFPLIPPNTTHNAILSLSFPQTALHYPLPSYYTQHHPQCIVLTLLSTNRTPLLPSHLFHPTPPTMHCSHSPFHKPHSITPFPLITPNTTHNALLYLLSTNRTPLLPFLLLHTTPPTIHCSHSPFHKPHSITPFPLIPPTPPTMHYSHFSFHKPHSITPFHIIPHNTTHNALHSILSINHTPLLPSILFHTTPPTMHYSQSPFNKLLHCIV